MQALERKQFNRYIEHFEFDHLFNQLGWNYKNHSFPKKAAETTYQFKLIAEKEGFAILICHPDSEGKIPDAQTRKRVHTEIAKLHHEHLIIFIDKYQSTQRWELLVREPNKPVRVVGHKWKKGQTPELLYQKLSGAFFTIEEDESGSLTIVDVVQRIKENFGVNAEKVTKKFYTEFKRQHSQFLDFIKGIDDTIPDKENTNKQWYASLMLNRLMFCYFIQKKGFLDQDRNYLKNKLKACQELAGQGKFYGFYRSFLLELFHDGLGKPMDKRSDDLPVELGKIPYLNGGLFDVHELERQFDSIKIDDDAFERIFEFFDQWEWHLDTREHAEGKTINPDVIGYIFEKYINDRAAMGAYYTKEDITDYIGKNTIIPFLFDEAERNYKEAFTGDAELWNSLKESGDEYIYDAIKHGVPKEGGLFDDLPDDVKEGFQPELERNVVSSDTKPHLWEIRKSWNQRAPQETGLPTEIYRELIERRKRYTAVKAKIEKGEITQINDFITYNLNIRQFAQDFIETTKDPVFIRHFYKALNKITILDPTCGSGAFLFAAMNILEPLYETCLKRMEEFVEEEEQPGKHKFFEETLEQINSEEHPNLQYFIYKSIILNNLYGVDIMKEAVEIAKLRLFLKLVATVDVEPSKKNFGLEPLPDIDFNIRAGNTLVGFATENELLRAIQVDQHGQYRAGYEQELEAFKEECELVAKAFSHFQNSQLINDQGSDSFREAKVELNRRLKELNHKLNVYLATNYGIDAQTKPQAFEKWLESHQPFHWFAEFYHIIAAEGGFDAIIGNPPYVELKKIDYKLGSYKSTSCGNLYGPIIERYFNIHKEKGRSGMIIPHSATCTDRMSSVMDILKRRSFWHSTFDVRPAKLFDGVDQRLLIYVTNIQTENIYSSKYYRWSTEYRPFLFENIEYADNLAEIVPNSIAKLGSTIELNILEKITKDTKLFIHYKEGTQIFYHNAPRYFIRAMVSPPYFWNEIDGVKTSTQIKRISFGTKIQSNAVGSVINSNLYYRWFMAFSDSRHLNNRELDFFPFSLENSSHLFALETLFIAFNDDLEKKKIRKKAFYKATGNVEYDEYFIKKSKPIIDQIDTSLAQHYRFTEEELDFIINYDIKYRMGKALFGEEDNGEEDED
ncbi:MAG: hypothetical protein OXH57_02070 [Ekhidna sp.]|nr:hypothetical protein [Ekhidna sp.]